MPPQLPAEVLLKILSYRDKLQELYAMARTVEDRIEWQKDVADDKKELVAVMHSSKILSRVSKDVIFRTLVTSNVRRFFDKLGPGYPYNKIESLQMYYAYDELNKSDFTELVYPGYLPTDGGPPVKHNHGKDGSCDHSALLPQLENLVLGGSVQLPPNRYMAPADADPTRGVSLLISRALNLRHICLAYESGVLQIARGVWKLDSPLETFTYHVPNSWWMSKPPPIFVGATNRYILEFDPSIHVNVVHLADWLALWRKPSYMPDRACQGEVPRPRHELTKIELDNTRIEVYRVPHNNLYTVKHDEDNGEHTSVSLPSLARPQVELKQIMRVMNWTQWVDKVFLYWTDDAPCCSACKQSCF